MKLALTWFSRQERLRRMATHPAVVFAVTLFVVGAAFAIIVGIEPQHRSALVFTLH